MNEVTVKTVADIRPGMKFVMSEHDHDQWDVVRKAGPPDLAMDGQPIQNKRGYLFWCKTKQMEQPLLMCLSDLPLLVTQGFRFYAP